MVGLGGFVAVGLWPWVGGGVFVCFGWVWVVNLGFCCLNGVGII